MTRWFVTLTLTVSLLTFAQNAQAACTTHTILTADGRLVMCTTCCTATGSCTTTCF